MQCTPHPFSVRSMLPGFAWPAVLSGREAELASLAFRLDVSQWWAPEQLRAAQFRQLHALLTHAAAHVPFYRIRLRQAGFEPSTPLSEAVWARIPTLTRHELQSRSVRLRASFVHPAHGAIAEAASGRLDRRAGPRSPDGNRDADAARAGDSPGELAPRGTARAARGPA